MAIKKGPVGGEGSSGKNAMGTESVVNRVLREARAEVNDEIIENAKKRMKIKLKELSAANKIVANINREIKELEIQLSQELE